MARIFKFVLGLFFLAGLLNGCASTDARLSFQDVRQVVENRSGYAVRWNEGTDEDKAVEEEVRRMLSGRLSVDQAAQIALLKNRRLQATYERLGIAQANLVQAGLLKNPVFDAELRFLEGSPAGKDPVLEMA